MLKNGDQASWCVPKSSSFCHSHPVGCSSGPRQGSSTTWTRHWALLNCHCFEHPSCWRNYPCHRMLQYIYIYIYIYTYIYILWCSSMFYRSYMIFQDVAWLSPDVGFLRRRRTWNAWKAVSPWSGPRSTARSPVAPMSPWKWALCSDFHQLRWCLIPWHLKNGGLISI